MPSRLEPTFARLRLEQRPGLVTYTTAADPDLPRSAELLRALDRAGADVLEVGVPFSDPLADGPVIQRATERALAAGGSLRTALKLIAEVRPFVTAPIVVFSYANPLLRLGLPEFARQASHAGVDGVLALDLPIEEAEEFQGTMSEAGIDTIFLLSPTTTDARIARAAALGQGFLYGISRLGVTGARAQVSSDAETLVRRIRRATTLPIALGFGIVAARARRRGRHVCRRGGRRQRAGLGDCRGARIAGAGRSRGDVRPIAEKRLSTPGSESVNADT